MSVAIWPSVALDDLKYKVAETQQREAEWIIEETLQICRDLKHGLEDCYALLAPIDPGSTLVMSTPRNEKVKGTITRVGTRIVKTSLHLQLRTLPAQTVALSPTEALHIPALDTLHTRLTESIDLLGLTLSKPQDMPALASTLSLLAEAISESVALLKGPPLNDTDPGWLLASCPHHLFQPSLTPIISLYIGLQESCIILWLRTLEPAGAPVHFGTKLGLAFGTVRRLEHDEMDMVFRYNARGSDPKRGSARNTPDSRFDRQSQIELQEVWVREKVRVESADPSLISLFSKLSYLGHMLGQARKNLAAVLELDQD